MKPILWKDKLTLKHLRDYSMELIELNVKYFAGVTVAASATTRFFFWKYSQKSNFQCCLVLFFIRKLGGVPPAREHTESLRLKYFFQERPWTRLTLFPINNQWICCLCRCSHLSTEWEELEETCDKRAAHLSKAITREQVREVDGWMDGHLY